jgi:hypothetical protein
LTASDSAQLSYKLIVILVTAVKLILGLLSVLHITHLFTGVLQADPATVRWAFRHGQRSFRGSRVRRLCRHFTPTGTTLCKRAHAKNDNAFYCRGMISEAVITSETKLETYLDLENVLKLAAKMITCETKREAKL